MILGRSANLYIAVIGAAINLAQLLHLVALSADGIAAANVFAAACVALLAGSDRLAVAKGRTAAARIAAKRRTA